MSMVLGAWRLALGVIKLGKFSQAFEIAYWGSKTVNDCFPEGFVAPFLYAYPIGFGEVFDFDYGVAHEFIPVKSI
jgi:hypothetical protein